MFNKNVGDDIIVLYLDFRFIQTNKYHAPKQLNSFISFIYF